MAVSTMPATNHAAAAARIRGLDGELLSTPTPWICVAVIDPPSKITVWHDGPEFSPSVIV
jgi:hypothetical protein